VTSSKLQHRLACITPARRGAATADSRRGPEAPCGGLGLRRRRILGVLDPISEFHVLDQFWQLIVAVDPGPVVKLVEMATAGISVVRLRV
jgi:hypothetical protein